MKTYVLILAKTFPQGHPRAGEETHFVEQFIAAYNAARFKDTWGPDFGFKLHTIRGNYDRWRKIFDQIDAGEACLSVRYWSGVPYRSYQVDICNLTKDDGIGLQKLEFEKGRGLYGQLITKAIVRGTWVVNPMLAKNDGLSLDDWKAWFSKTDLSKPLAIIQFTRFRY